MWPGAGITFNIPVTDFPEATSCTAYDVVIALNTAYITANAPGDEEDLIRMKVTPSCLSQTAATSGGGQLPVAVTFMSKFVETSDAQLPFVIDFGGKVLEQGPLKLFNVTGSNRTDVVYAVDEGIIYLMVYPPSTSTAATITVSVPAGATTNSDGTPNGAASATAEYKPKVGWVKSVGIVLIALFAGFVLASWSTSFIVSCMQPWATAGSMGYSALAFILWAQKLYLTGLMSTPAMPANYRAVSSAFDWATFQAPLPWEWGSGGSASSLYRANATVPSTVFESNAAVFMGITNNEFSSYSGERAAKFC